MLSIMWPKRMNDSPRGTYLHFHYCKCNTFSTAIEDVGLATFTQKPRRPVTINRCCGVSEKLSTRIIILREHFSGRRPFWVRGNQQWVLHIILVVHPMWLRDYISRRDQLIEIAGRWTISIGKGIKVMNSPQQLSWEDDDGHRNYMLRVLGAWRSDQGWKHSFREEEVTEDRYKFNWTKYHFCLKWFRVGITDNYCICGKGRPRMSGSGKYLIEAVENFAFGPILRVSFSSSCPFLHPRQISKYGSRSGCE